VNAPSPMMRRVTSAARDAERNMLRLPSGCCEPHPPGSGAHHYPCSRPGAPPPVRHPQRPSAPPLRALLALAPAAPPVSLGRPTVLPPVVEPKPPAPAVAVHPPPVCSPPFWAVGNVGGFSTDRSQD
jgi:hypothetical protein